MLAKHMIRSGILLALFAMTGTGLVALTFENTRDKIAEAERNALLKKLHAVVKPNEHDNELFTDLILVQSKDHFGTDAPVPVFRARMNNQPVAVLITTTAPDGYSGNIKLLVGIRTDGTLAGVRALTHKETPGLGDAIEERRSPWVFIFDGRALNDPVKEMWKVQRDRGGFDQITGATITSRAVVKAVHKALEYYQSNKDYLFNEGFNTENTESEKLDS